MISKVEHLKILENKFHTITWENLNSVKKSYFDFIKSGTVPAIKIKDEISKKVTLGMSKKGGTPHLGSNMKWPEFENKPMVFLAQLNLSEIAPYQIEDHLPKSGILYFFAYFEDPINKFGAEFNFIQSKKKYKILFYDGDSDQLKITPFPKTMIPDYHFEESAMVFESFFEIPNNIYEYAEWEELSDNDHDNIIEFHYSILKSLDTSQILGIPRPLQDNVACDWAYAYINQDELELDDEYEEEPEIDEQELLATEFVNILSMPIFNKIGDAQGYFGIRKDDLANKKFEECIFVMQGT